MISLQNASARRLVTAALLAASLLSAWYWTQAALSASRPAAAVAPVTPLTSVTPKPASPSAPIQVLAGSANDMARVLGAKATALAGAASTGAERFRVLGVIVRASGQGVALIAVDGQSPRVFSVGAQVAPGFMLQSVQQRQVMLAATRQGPPLAVLTLPEPGSATAATTATTAAAPVGASRALPVLPDSLDSPGATSATSATGSPSSPSVPSSPGSPASPLAQPLPVTPTRGNPALSVEPALPNEGPTRR